MAANTILIQDIWGSRNKPSEIKVQSQIDSCAFPYDDSSERRDQHQNALDFAQTIVIKGRAAGLSMHIDDVVDGVNSTPCVSPDDHFDAVKVEVLFGPSLNFAVAKALDLPLVLLHDHFLATAKQSNMSVARLTQQLDQQPNLWVWLDNVGATHHIEPYSEAWSQGGPVIDAQRIEFRQATTGMHASYPKQRTVWGKDHLEAGLRCFVAQKLGSTVQIPKSIHRANMAAAMFPAAPQEIAPKPSRPKP